MELTLKLITAEIERLEGSILALQKEFCALSNKSPIEAGYLEVTPVAMAGDKSFATIPAAIEHAAKTQKGRRATTVANKATTVAKKAASDPKRGRQGGVGKAVLEAINGIDGVSISLNQILESTKAKKPSVVAALKALQAKGKIIKGNNGLYMPSMLPASGNGMTDRAV